MTADAAVRAALDAFYTSMIKEGMQYTAMAAAVRAADAERAKGADEVVERLLKPLFDDPEVMKRWDAWRAYIAKGGTASWPRDAFEVLLECIDEERIGAAALIASLRAEVARLREAEAGMRSSEPFEEAARRYPHAADAIAFLWGATGASIVKPTADDIQWAKDTIRALPLTGDEA